MLLPPGLFLQYFTYFAGESGEMFLGKEDMGINFHMGWIIPSFISRVNFFSAVNDASRDESLSSNPRRFYQRCASGKEMFFAAEMYSCRTRGH